MQHAFGARFNKIILQTCGLVEMRNNLFAKVERILFSNWLKPLIRALGVYNVAPKGAAPFKSWLIPCCTNRAPAPLSVIEGIVLPLGQKSIFLCDNLLLLRNWDSLCHRYLIFVPLEMWLELSFNIVVSR